MIDKLTSTKGIALLLSALIVGFAAGPAAAAVLDEQTVTVDDPDSQEIEATVELTDDPSTQNTALELVNESGNTVQTVQLEGSSGDNITENFTVESSGDYTVSLTADTSGVATLHSAEVVDNSTGGLFGTGSTDQQFLWSGAIGVIAVIGMLGYRELDNDGY